MAEAGNPEKCTVAIVGGGPAGLATATELARLGVTGVVVLEREAEAGGIPRHCGHSPFGMREFGRCYTGPRYAEHLRRRAEKAAAVDMRVNTTVAAADAGGRLTLATPEGNHRLDAERVVLATGARETPRAARLVSGGRPAGIITTGALQAMVYLHRRIPFRRPLIVGSELVSFSALLTCRHAGIKPAALLEANPRLTAWKPLALLPRALRIPLYTGARIVEILGAERVTGVRVAMKNPSGQGESETTLPCDGVIFTGQFTPESALLRMGHIEVDPASGGPVVDQFGRCSDPTYFAAGNLLRPVETAGWCWREGIAAAAWVHMDLAGQLPDPHRRTPITFTEPAIRYVVPQTIAVGATLPNTDTGMQRLQLRFTTPASGRLSLRLNSREIQSKSLRALPERRILLPLDAPLFHETKAESNTLHLEFERT